MAADGAAIGHIAVTTTLSAAAGALVAFFVTFLIHKRFDVGMTLNGALAGLVGITAGCAGVTPVGSLVIGVISGVVVVYSVSFFDKIKIDDPVGAISVHGACGAIGTILVGFLDSSNGVFYGGSLSFLGVQVLGVVAMALWAFVSSLVLFKIIDLVLGLRVSEEDEVLGLDYTEHGASAYPDFNISAFGTRI